MSELRLALAGDTMLGRKVADAIRRREAEPLVDAGVVQSVREADLFVLNLECCIAEQGERWPVAARGRAAEARVLPHAARRRRRRKVDPPPLPRRLPRTRNAGGGGARTPRRLLALVTLRALRPSIWAS